MEEKAAFELGQATEEEKKRAYISLMNEQERQKLLERIAEETESEGAAKQKNWKFQLTSLIPSFAKRFFEKAMETPPETAEPGKSGEPAAMDNRVPGSLEAAKATLTNDRYAVFVLMAAKEPDGRQTEALTEAGKSVWGSAWYPQGKGVYVVLQPDCRLNLNALKKKAEQFRKLFSSLLPEEHQIPISIAFDSGKKHTPVDALLEEVWHTCEKERHKVICSEKEQGVITEQTPGEQTSEVPNDWMEAIRRDAILQAMRAFEQQYEEEGELNPEEIKIRQAADMTPEEYDSYLTEEQMAIKQEAIGKYVDDDLLVAQVLHNIRKHNTIDDPLYLIAIATVDMNTLVLLDDLLDFEVLCEEQQVELIGCSYLYAISRSGGHWYGNNHATKEIEALFSALSDAIVANNGRFQRELLLQIPNIGIFKDIYLQ